MSREVTAEEALAYWYDLAKREDYLEGMVEGMISAVGRGWTKMVRSDKGEIAFNVTPEGLKENERIMARPEAKDALARMKRSQIERS